LRIADCGLPIGGGEAGADPEASAVLGFVRFFRGRSIQT
jgi:hypothetical protein